MRGAVKNLNGLGWLWLCIFSCLFAARPARSGETAETTVTVEGYVLLDGLPVTPTMQEMAREQARRRAIEAGGETVIERQTEVENFALVKDVMLTDVRGLIKSQEWLKYRNGRDYQERDGKLYVNLRAVVKIGKIESDIPAITELLSMKGSPRLAVLVRQETGTGIDSGFVAGEVNRLLIEKRFTMMDTETAMEAIGREAEIMFDEPERAALIAQRLPVDFVVVGDIQAEPDEPFTESGQELHRHRLSVRFSIIDKHLGRLVGVVQRSFHTKSGLPSQAGKILQNAVASTGQNVAEELLAALLYHFGYQTNRLELIISKSTRAKLDKLRVSLREGLGGKQVFTIRTVRRREAVIDFESQLTPSMIASFLEEQTDVPLFVNDQVESKLFCEMQ